MKPTLNKTPVNSSLNATEPPDHQKIQVRAYELYREHGGEDGHDVEDWLQAEAEITVQQAAPQPLDSIAA